MNVKNSLSKNRASYFIIYKKENFIMGPKYEFTGETKKWGDSTLHRIRRLSDGKLGGWIESEENLSQNSNCWVDDEAKVYDNAYVYSNAQVFGNAEVHSNARVYDHAKVYGNAEVYGNAKVYVHAEVYGDAKVYDNARVGSWAEVYGNAKVFGDAKICGGANVYGNAEVYGGANVYGNAEIFGNAEICGYMKIDSGKYTNEKFSCDEDLSNDGETKKVIQDFIYSVNDSNKLTTQTEYDSINEFFDTSIAENIKLDTLIICSVDTKEPLIKLQKVKVDNKTEFKFIVDITNEDSDDFIFRSTIKSQEQLNQLIQRTVEALKQYPEFNKYADDLESCL